MIRFLFFIQLLVLVEPIYASTSWELKVFYPDKEIKTYLPGKSQMDIPLGIYDWSCFVTEVVFTKRSSLDLTSRAIICSKDDGKTIISSTARCGGNKISPMAISDFSELTIISNKISRELKLLCK